MKKKLTKSVIAIIIAGVVLAGGALAYVIHTANVSAFSGKIGELISKNPPSSAEPEIVVTANGMEVGGDVKLNEGSVFPILWESPEGSLVNQNGLVDQPLHQSFLVSAKGGDLEGVGYQISAKANIAQSELLSALRVRVFESADRPMRKIEFPFCAVGEDKKEFSSHPYFLANEIKKDESYIVGIDVWFDETTLRSLEFDNNSPDFEISVLFTDGLGFGSSGEY